MQSLEHRLESLAKRYRYLWMFTCFVIAMLMVELTKWVKDVEDRTKRTAYPEATSLMIRDQEGRVRASLGMEDDGVALRMTGPDGINRACMVVTNDGVAVVGALDGKGKAGAYLAGENDKASIGLWDANKMSRGSWSVNSADGKTGLHMHDDKGQIRASLSLSKTRPGIQFVNEKGDSLLMGPEPK